MAYRFNGTTDEARFLIGALGGITLGAQTYAVLFKINTVEGVDRYVTTITDAAVSVTNWNEREQTGITPLIGSTTGTAQATFTLNSSALWYLLVCTWSGSGNARFHLNSGSGWTHADQASGTMTSQAIGATNRIYVPVPASFGGIGLKADYVCVGIKNTDSTDLAVETLSSTSFAPWRSFGFSWLIGFDSQFTSAGLLLDQSAAASGNEASQTGTSVVSNPPGWSWTGGTGLTLKSPPPGLIMASLAHERNAERKAAREGEPVPPSRRRIRLDYRKKKGR